MSIDVYPPKGLLVPGTEQVTETLDIFLMNLTTSAMQFQAWPDAVATNGYMHWRVPAAYAGGDLTLRVLRRGAVAGTGIFTVQAYRFRSNGSLTTLLASTALNFSAPDGSTSVASIITIPGTGLQLTDIIRIDLNRDGANASDTINNTVYFDGAYITYLATVPRVFNAQTYEEGSFTVTATGFSGTALSGTVRYVRIGKQVTMLLPNFTGTSNATNLTLTGIPAALTPVQTVQLPISVADNGTYQIGLLAAAGVTWQATLGNGGVFTASGSKVFNWTTFSYLIA